MLHNGASSLSPGDRKIKGSIRRQQRALVLGGIRLSALFPGALLEHQATSSLVAQTHNSLQRGTQSILQRGSAGRKVVQGDAVFGVRGKHAFLSSPTVVQVCSLHSRHNVPSWPMLTPTRKLLYSFQLLEVSRWEEAFSTA